MKTITTTLTQRVFIFLTTLLLTGCFTPSVTVDSQQYVSGFVGTVTIMNGDETAIYLPGCATYTTQKLLDEKWEDQGPNIVCIVPGNARHIVDPSLFEIDFSISDTGTFRIKALVGEECDSELIFSEQNCKNIIEAYSPEFEVSPAETLMCVTDGCSGQVCRSADSPPVITTCEWREEYACLRFSSCSTVTVNDTATCGWVRTPEMVQCLEDIQEPSTF